MSFSTESGRIFGIRFQITMICRSPVKGLLQKVTMGCGVQKMGQMENPMVITGVEYPET